MHTITQSIHFVVSRGFYCLKYENDKEMWCFTNRTYAQRPTPTNTSKYQLTYLIILFSSLHIYLTYFMNLINMFIAILNKLIKNDKQRYKN